MAWVIKEANGAFTKFYQTCEPQMQEAIDQRMAILLLKGHLAGLPASRPLEDGIFELRARFKKKQVRFLYCFRKRQQILILLSAFKDQKKLPRRLIEKAKKIRDEIDSGAGKHDVSNL